MHQFIGSTKRNVKEKTFLLRRIQNQNLCIGQCIGQLFSNQDTFARPITFHRNKTARVNTP